MDFDALMRENYAALERYARYRAPSLADADDIIQETMLSAYLGFASLRSAQSFKPWLMAIARNKARDVMRTKYRRGEISLDALNEHRPSEGRMCHRAPDDSAVSQTLERMNSHDEQLLSMFYLKDMPQSDIAARLGIPLGTVKSRLHSARERFRAAYPREYAKGDTDMKKLPLALPKYSITPLSEPPFDIVWEELMGWFLVPKLGEELSWGMYDLPSRRCDRLYDMRVTGKAEVHGIEGMEICADEKDISGREPSIKRMFVAQLTDTHCRCLATMHTEDGVRRFITFLDGDAFLPNWGFGEDNCGNETHLSAKGDITRSGSSVTCSDKPFLLDIVGRYRVDIAGKSFDTVCVMDIETYNAGVVSEQYIDRNGRTVLWRRFNRDDWAIERYGKRWSELLPDNERLLINGDTYVEWYDCITDYVL